MAEKTPEDAVIDFLCRCNFDDNVHRLAAETTDKARGAMGALGHLGSTDEYLLPSQRPAEHVVVDGAVEKLKDLQGKKLFCKDLPGALTLQQEGNGNWKVHGTIEKNNAVYKEGDTYQISDQQVIGALELWTKIPDENRQSALPAAPPAAPKKRRFARFLSTMLQPLTSLWKKKPMVAEIRHFYGMDDRFSPVNVDEEDKVKVFLESDPHRLVSLSELRERFGWKLPNSKRFVVDSRGGVEVVSAPSIVGRILPGRKQTDYWAYHTAANVLGRKDEHALRVVHKATTPPPDGPRFAVAKGPKRSHPKPQSPSLNLEDSRRFLSVNHLSQEGWMPIPQRFEDYIIVQHAGKDRTLSKVREVTRMQPSDCFLQFDKKIWSLHELQAARAKMRETPEKHQQQTEDSSATEIPERGYDVQDKSKETLKKIEDAMWQKNSEAPALSGETPVRAETLGKNPRAESPHPKQGKPVHAPLQSASQRERGRAPDKNTPRGRIIDLMLNFRPKPSAPEAPAPTPAPAAPAAPAAAAKPEEPKKEKEGDKSKK